MNNVLEVLVSAKEQGKERKGIRTEKEEIKLSLKQYGCVEYHNILFKQESIDKFQGVISKFSKVSEHKGASVIAQLIKNPPEMQETPVQFLGWEDPLEKG